MLTVAIQAGGESRRMGQDKALMPFLGQPLIEHVLQRILAIADEVVVTTNQPENYDFLKVRLFEDPIRNRGALGGLYTALQAASHPFVAVIGCDMPFIHAEMLKAEYEAMVTSQPDIVVPRMRDGLQPFHAIYRRDTCLPFVRSALEDGHWRADAWFDQVQVKYFPETEILKYDPEMLSFWNINTLEDFRAAEERASQL